MAGGGHPAVKEELALGRGPTLLGDRLTGQVDHRLGPGQGRLQLRLLPGGRLGRIPLQALQGGIGDRWQGPGLAAKQAEAMALAQQQGHQLPANKTAAANKQDLHTRPSGIFQWRQARGPGGGPSLGRDCEPLPPWPKRQPLRPPRRQQR